MTRWARSGNSQKHKKMPADPTPWSEFGNHSSFKRKLKKQIFATVNNEQSQNASDGASSSSALADVSSYVMSKHADTRVDDNSLNIFQSELNIEGDSTLKPVGESCLSPEEINNHNMDNNALTSSVTLNKNKMGQGPMSSAMSNNIGFAISQDNQKLKRERKSKNKQAKCANAANMDMDSSKLVTDLNCDLHEPYKDVAGPHLNESGTTLAKHVGEEVHISGKKDKRKRKKHRQNTESNVNETVNLSLQDVDEDQSTLDASNSEQIEVKKRKKKKHGQNTESNFSKSVDLSPQDVNQDQSTLDALNSEQIEVKKTKSKRKKNKMAKHAEASSKVESEALPQSTETTGKNSIKKKNSFRGRILTKRINSGMILLPEKVEAKIYRLKRSLRKQGESGEKIRHIIRKARRMEELEYRKTMKTCFNCRKMGHVMSDCPKINADNEQGTGICFKCGSTEHASHMCNNKNKEFAFAKCFICHKQGHLSRNCPNNTHGVFPKGGKCHFCGEINHKKQDCPKLNKKTKCSEEILTADIIGKGNSVDDEVIENATILTPQAEKKPKLIKF